MDPAAGGGELLLPGLHYLRLAEEQGAPAHVLNLGRGAASNSHWSAGCCGVSITSIITKRGWRCCRIWNWCCGPVRLSLLFVTLSCVLWLVTTVYAIGYLEGSPHRSRFFGFFSLCVTATVGVALAGNLITFLLFYELLTLSTYPLVVHRGTEVARRAGQTYLRYTFSVAPCCCWERCGCIA